MTFLLECSLRAAVIMAIGLGVASLPRRSSAAMRHSLLAASLLCAAVLPILTLASPEWNLELPAGLTDAYNLDRLIASPQQTKYADRSPDRGPATPPSDNVAVEAATPMALPALLNAEAREPDRAPEILRYAGAVWAAGAFVVFGWLILGWAHLAWIASRAKPVLHGYWPRFAEDIARDYGLQRRVRLLRSHYPAMLATWGIFPPKVVLPRDAEQWHEDRVQVVLRHELAHVRRNDWLIQMLSELLRTVYWFNPLVWLACARLRRESEQAADDTVLNSGVAGSDYAAHLLDLARTFRKPRCAWSPALLMARESTLEQRFKALLNPSLNRRALTRLAIASTGIFFLGVTLPVAALRLSAQEVLSLELPFHVMRAPLPIEPQAALPPSSEQASIDGVVIRTDSGEPLGEVHVELNTPGSRVSSRSVTTAGDGRFELRDVPPGDYQIVAAREGGYLPAAYGQRSPTGSGLTIHLAAGQRMSGLRISMVRPGSISGRVLHRDGEPVGRAQVQALRTVYVDGQRSESVVASVSTDDRGEYRLYWLPPGQYRVSATPQDIRRGWVPVIANSLDAPSTLYMLLTPPAITRRVLENGEIQEEVQVPAYFPGTTDIASASAIEVRAGADVTGVDITVVPPARTYRIRGMLINAVTAQPVGGGTVAAMPLANSGNLIGVNGKSDTTGKFEISGVLPGPYMLTATAGSSDDRNGLAGSVPVIVGAQDLENLSIVVSPGVDIPVKVTIEGRPAGAGISFRLRTIPAQSFLGGFMPMRPGTPQWNLLTTSQFTMEGVRPGDYKFAFFAMGGGAPSTLPVYVKSIKMGAVDVLNGLLRVGGGLDHPLEIVLSANVSTLEGMVVNDEQVPVPNVSVALIPDTPYRGRTDLYKTATSDASGRFQIAGIAPGNYRAFSWESVEGWPWQDEEWLRPYEGRGRPLHIGEGSKENVRLTVIR